MLLDIDGIRKKVKLGVAPHVKAELDQIKKHDDRCIFHTEPTQEERSLAYRNIFLAWVNTIINDEKHEVFRHLMTLPIETVDFMEGLFNELKKIFESQNRNISFSFDNPELNQDFQLFLEEIKDAEFWKERGFNAMKSSISNLIVVDLPMLQYDDEGTVVQESKYPKPYYYFLSPHQVMDIHYDKGDIEWIIFTDTHNSDLIHYFDTEKLITFMKLKGGKYQIFEPIYHGIGWTPVTNFWSTLFNSNSCLQRRAPISNTLGKLDWLLFLMVSQKHTELYAGFPIYVMYERKCTYQDDNGNQCENGYVNVNVRIANTDEFRMTSKACPSCSNRNDLGAGTLLKAPPRMENGDPDMLQGVNVIPAEEVSLNYLLKRIQQYEVAIVTNVIGLLREPSKEAMNELQIESGYESRTNVLLDVKSNFEKAHKFVLDTLGRLRYGELYKGSVVFYGDKFYLYDANDLLADYDKSKASGTPMFELSNQYEQVIQTKYRNNPEMIERYAILSEIEPFPLVSMKDLKDLRDVYLPTTQELQLKSRFDQLVKRFENEFTNIASFMIGSPKEKKVEFVKDILLRYTEELVVAEPAAAPAGTNPAE